MLEAIKELMSFKNIKVPSDSILNLYINRSVLIVKKYLNTEKLSDEQILELYPDAIIHSVVESQRIDASGNKGIKSQSQGARSVTYSDEKSFTVSDDIKALLPTPRIRMR